MIISTQDVVNSWLDAFKSGDLDKVGSLLSDKFEFKATNLPNPITKAQWVEFIRTLQNAFPDVNFNWRSNGTNGNSVDLVYQLTGSHTQELKLSPMGMQDFAATGKSFSLPEDTYSLTIEGGKIVRIDVDPPVGAGLGGILAQLGLA